VASFLMLFLELALIRWTLANNLYLASLTNFVLLASFLGIGAGFLRAGARPDFFRLTPAVLLALVAFVLAFPVSLVHFSGPDQVHGSFGGAPLPRDVSLAVIFVLTVAVMAGVGQTVAHSFRLFAPLDAYRLDILGSLAGITAFSTLSFLQLPPVAWGAVVTVAVAALLGPPIHRWQAAALALTLLLLAGESLLPNQHWSPYYKIIARPDARTRSLRVSANNIPHQTAYPVSSLRAQQPFYFFPYRHVPPARRGNVLIVGAGTGNDVAVALSEGARHVDAVEIDPELQHLGAVYHPDHPYQSPRVTVHIDDGRAYLDQTSKRYDLILFALPDSLTTLSGQANLRLENYLFTIEAMRTARAHLAAGGTFSMYNFYEPFLLGRYAGTLATVYGTAPCVELGARLGGRRQAVLTETLGRPVASCTDRWHGTSLAPATDDWPFPYLPHRSIPRFYLNWLLAIAIASVVVVRLAGGPLRRLSAYVDLALMGAAFLLLETKNIVGFALLFGTTWFVNSLVFAGVLLAVAAAVETARRVTLPTALLYAALGGALAAAWFVPPESLLALSPLPRFLAATGLAFAPIYLANLVFAQRFRETATATTAFAANLLGAMLGGAAEYLALITGYRFLLIVVALLYAAAFLTRPLVSRT
jgi:hypothetical protein